MKDPELIVTDTTLQYCDEVVTRISSLLPKLELFEEQNFDCRSPCRKIKQHRVKHIGAIFIANRPRHPEIVGPPFYWQVFFHIEQPKLKRLELRYELSDPAWAEKVQEDVSKHTAGKQILILEEYGSWFTDLNLYLILDKKES